MENEDKTQREEREIREDGRELCPGENSGNGEAGECGSTACESRDEAESVKNPGAEEEGNVCPPDPKREFEVEEEWAETLGMDFDAERVKVSQTPPPYSGMVEGTPENAGHGPMQQDIPPVYVMSPGEMPPLDSMSENNMAFRPEPMPETYMLWAVLSTVCCCLPAGIIAIVYSSMVSTRYYARDYEGARKASRNAEKWIIASIVVGVIVNALYMPLSLMMPV